MPFIYLSLFALICLQMQTQWPTVPSWLSDEACSILVGAMVLASWLIAWLIAGPIAGQIARHPEQRSVLLRRYSRLRRWHFFGLIACYLTTLYLLGWGHLFKTAWSGWVATLINLGRDGSTPGIEIGLMAPFFAALLLAWERFYLVEKTAYEVGNDIDRFVSRANYLLLQVRHQLILVMPPIVLLLMQQLLFAFFPDWDESSYVPAIIGTLMLAAAFVSMPFLLRLFLGLKPLPPGPLRDRLEQTATRLNFGYSNVLVWNTRNLFANALVTGFIPRMRYVILTDRLIDELTPDEIESVFGHEVGHIKHHHLLFYLAFFLSSLIALGIFWENVSEWIKQQEIMTWLQSTVSSDIRDTLKTYSSFGQLGLLGIFVVIVFGFLSRRCERQADLFGAHTVSTEAFISALEKVAVINGISRDRGGWQHPTIAQRIAFLRQMHDNPALVPAFHRSLALIRWSFFLGLGVLLSCLELPQVWMYLHRQR